MNNSAFQSLSEAYNSIYQLDEVSDRKVKAVGKARARNVNKAFNKYYNNPDDSREDTQRIATAVSKENRFKNLAKKRTQKEEYDTLLFDESASSDLADAAQKRANQRKNQTPERKATYQRLADKARRRATGPFKPGNIRSGMNQAERDARRDDDVYHDSLYGDGNKKYGKGSVTKNPRKLRKQMAIGEIRKEEFIIDYLLDEGFVNNEVSAEVFIEHMSDEWLDEILESAADQSNKQIEKGVKTTYKAGNVLDNLHQGRSPGMDKLPASERRAKEKRMRGRLKTRRDDLFGERNKREDEERAEMKKRFGL